MVAAAIEHIEAALNLGVGFDPANSAGIFTAGMAEYAEVALVGRLAAAFAAQAPKATLRLTPLTGADAAEQLERGAIDVAVAHLAPCRRRSKSTLLLARPVCRRCPQGPSDRRRSRCRSRPTRRCDHVLVSPRGDTSGALDRILVDFGLRRRIALLVATYLAVPAALAASDLVATVPSRDRAPDRRHRRDRNHAAADRFLR